MNDQLTNKYYLDSFEVILIILQNILEFIKNLDNTFDKYETLK